MYGDERVNHTIHWSSLLERAAKEEKPDWINKDWFKKYVDPKWHKLDPGYNKICPIDETKLPRNKAPVFENNYGDARILKMLRE